MLDETKFRQEVSRLERDLRKKLNRNDGTFAELVALAGRRLPRYARKSADKIIAAQSLDDHPKLSRQVNHSALKAPLRKMGVAVEEYDPRDRRIGLTLDVLSSIAFNLLLLAFFLFVLLRYVVPA